MAVGRILLNRKDKTGKDKTDLLGCGFALATTLGAPSRVVLTAYHVIVADKQRNVMYETSSLRFATEAGRMIPVFDVQVAEDLDIAVLHLSEEVREGLAVGHAVEGAAWQVEAQPLGSDPKLTGTITATRRRFTDDRGHETHVVQLLVDQRLGEYEGYSGSPVVAATPPGAVSSQVALQSPPVIGILVEQLRLRIPALLGQPKPQASEVLYAIPIQDVLARFKLDAAQAPVPPEDMIAREDELRKLVPAYMILLANLEPEPHCAFGLVFGLRTVLCAS